MVAMVVVAVAFLFVLLRYTRLGIRIRAGTLDLETVVGARHQCAARCARSISPSAFFSPG